METENIEKSEKTENKLFFGNRPVKAHGEADLGNTTHVWIEFEDGTREVVNKAEWDEVNSFEPKDEDFNWDKKRCMPVATDILAVLRKHNVRLEDLRTIYTLVADTFQLRIDQVKELSYGQPAWSIRVDDIQKILDDNKDKPIQTQFIRKVQGGLLDL